MSSSTFSTELSPEPFLRRLVLYAGGVTTLLGVVIVASLPIDPLLRAFGSALWLFHSGSELLIIASGHKQFGRLRLDSSGALELLGADGIWQPAILQSGCLVSPRFAWLRMTSRDGQHYHELVRGHCRESQQWRRFQVIWRHLGGIA